MLSVLSLIETREEPATALADQNPPARAFPENIAPFVTSASGLKSEEGQYFSLC